MKRSARGPFGSRKLLMGIGLAAVFQLGISSAWAQHAAPPPPAVLQLQQTFIQVIEQAEESVVSIARFKEPPRTARHGLGGMLGNSFEPGPDFIPNSFGSGIIIAPQEDPTKQFILTNYHVVRGGPAVGQKPSSSESHLYVRLANRRGFYAQILAADPRSDLAVLPIDHRALGITPQDLKPIKLSDGDEVKKGQLVVALGNPYAIARDGSASASWGMISNISRRPSSLPAHLDDETREKRKTIHHFGTLLQTDTRLTLGTSGGALLNLQGELIGITTSLAALEGYEKSVGYALPIDATTRRIVKELAQGREVEYGFLGVAPKSVNTDGLQRFPDSVNQAAAAQVVNVIDNSPASLGGINPGDVILAVANEPVYSDQDLIREIALQPPGSRVGLRIWRPGHRDLLTQTVELGKWPVRDTDGIIAPQPRHSPWRGLTVDYPTARSRFFQEPSYKYHSAVLVTNVDPNSSAAQAKLQPGDFISHVNGMPVQTPAKFHSVVESLRDQDKVRLRLVDGTQVVLSR